MAAPTFLKRLDAHLHLPGGTVFNLNTDTSSGEVYASAGPKNSETWQVHRIIGMIEDSKVNADDYGAILGGLTNGVNLILKRGSTIAHSFMQDHPVKTSAQWARFCHDATSHAWGAGNEFMTFRWTFAAADIPSIILHGPHNDSMGLLLNDDMTGLVAHEFVLQGSKRTFATQQPRG